MRRALEEAYYHHADWIGGKALTKAEVAEKRDRRIRAERMAADEEARRSAWTASSTRRL
jgi:hypothetical protein